MGVGEPGQHVTAGTEIPYRFAMVTLGGPRLEPQAMAKQLEELGASFGLGAQGGAEASFTAGEAVGNEMFFTVEARSNEACFEIKPHPTIDQLLIKNLLCTPTFKLTSACVVRP